MRYFLIAGEASGDLHASNLMRELKKQDSQAEFCFLGGDLMAAQGGKLVKHYREMAFMGIINVLKNSKTVLQNLNDCKKAIIDFQPDAVILIDYPSFNLRIARFVKETSKNTSVYYYISPKIWAWKEFRIKQIKKYIDAMFTILPFETEFYKKHNYAVTYVGNPTVESISTRPDQTQTFEEFFKENQLSGKPIIALLAGSRKQEISSCLPKMLEAVESFADFQPVIAGAPGIDTSFYSEILNNKNLSIIFGKTYQLLAHSHAAIVNSGTATLETALIRTPQAVVYSVAFGRIAMIIKKLFINVKYVSLVNLIAEKEVVKELIAHHFTVDNLKQELSQLLFNEVYRKQMQENYDKIKKKLGNSGASERAAEGIIGKLRNKVSALPPNLPAGGGGN